jgi:probable HAF family extracellular repeat protein
MAPVPRRFLGVLAVVAAILGALCSPRPAAAQGYYLEDLGTFGGKTSAALAINDAGLVGGWAVSSSNWPYGAIPRPFLWVDGALTLVGSMGYGSNAFIAALNNQDPPQACGWSGNGGGSTAVLWSPDRSNPGSAPPRYGDGGSVSPPRGHSSRATDINDIGEVVGSALIDPSGTSRAFLYTFVDRVRPENGFHTRQLETLGGRQGEAYSINNGGLVVGWSQTADGEQHACLWQGKEVADLGTLGGRMSTAYAINASGQIAGTSTTKDAEQHACLWSGGKVLDMGTLPNCSGSIAYGINDAGQVVGVACPDGDEAHERAFLWTEAGGMVDLNTPLFEALGWRLRQARGINNKGQIVGWGTRNGEQRAFRLSRLPPTDSITGGRE